MLALAIPEEWSEPFNELHISGLRGDNLKGNEDKLDAVVCLYVAGLYSLCPHEKVFGDATDGYIYVPRKVCISEAT